MQLVATENLESLQQAELAKQHCPFEQPVVKGSLGSSWEGSAKVVLD